MKLRSILGMGVILLWVGACNSGKTGGGGEQISAESLRSEALDKLDKIAPLLDELVGQRNRINVQGQALSEEDMNFVMQVEEIENKVGESKARLNELGSHLQENQLAQWKQLIKDLKRLQDKMLELNPTD